MPEHERATLDALIEGTVTRSLGHLSASDLRAQDLAVIEMEIRQRAKKIVEETLLDSVRELADGANLVEDWVAKVSKLRLFDIEVTAAAQSKILEQLPLFSPRLMSVSDILRYALNEDREAWIDAGFIAMAKLRPSAQSAMRVEWREKAWRLAGRCAGEHARFYDNSSSAFTAQRYLHARYDRYMKVEFATLQRDTKRIRLREWLLGLIGK
ncbi:hypothetical protein [uncultured Methylobacterium sp.]|uniref:hypothetical protein n=1 Tax=uncultured Methylobacterium sp. TaxID=157278 RepID=UPI0035C9BE84